MKKIACLLLVVGLSGSANGQFMGEIQYIKNKGVMLDRQLIKKPRNLKPIIEAKNNAELTALFKKYRRTHFTQQVIARIRDFGMTYSVLHVFGQPQIQPIPTAMAITGAGGAELLRRPTRYALKELVEQYNDLILIEKIQQEKHLSARGN
jgi:hypothetical protein